MTTRKDSETRNSQCCLVDKILPLEMLQKEPRRTKGKAVQPWPSSALGGLLPTLLANTSVWMTGSPQGEFEEGQHIPFI